MTRRTEPLPELLAPAGTPEALRAAVAAGADAVYLGVDRFNARRGAENFALGTLAQDVRLAHLAGVRVYLTLNILLLTSELAEALDVVDRAWEAGIDAVIVQDLGLMRALRAALPHVRIHASTQLNTHNAATARLLADEGVSRVTLARELDIGEIAHIVDDSPVEAESFVHGALCVCYSGQCLMSSLIGQRSANRGLCAQPCRLAYELVDETGRVRASQGAHLLSPRDLSGITVLDRLSQTGVASLKIEGRMKSAEYVALVTGVYRHALDRLRDSDDYSVRDGELSVLSEAFNRGFSEAYLVGERGNDMMSYQRPNNRGVPLGRVARVSDGVATVSLDTALDAEDTIVFWTSGGRFAQRAGALVVDGSASNSAPAGKKVEIAVEGSPAAGDRVFRVANAALLAAARRTFTGDSRALVPLDFAVRVVVGEPLTVQATDDHGRLGRSRGAVVEPARTKPLTAEEVREHVGRLGGTPYLVRGFDLALSPDAGLGFSALHRARREALAAYEDGLLAEWSARVRIGATPPPLPAARARSRAVALEAEVATLAAALVALESGADAAHVPVAALGGASAPDGVVPLLPRIAHDTEVGAVLDAARDARRAVVGNLGLLPAAAQLAESVDAHWSLGALNPWTVAELTDIGARFVWLSPELSGRQIAEIAERVAVPVGIGVFGRQELMVTEHCVLMAEGECTGSCVSCGRRTGSRVLRDRKGYEFPVVSDAHGRSHVYNSVPLDLTTALAEIMAAGVSAVRMDLALDSIEGIGPAVGHFRRALDRAAAGLDTGPALISPSTSGHFFRGVR